MADYAMPSGNANRLIARLRQHAATSEIPVIVLTGISVGGTTDYSLEREMRSVGAVGYLTKPIQFERLLDELRRFVDLPRIAST